MNSTRNRSRIIDGALLFSGLGLVAAGLLMAAPEAQAQLDLECKPGCWAAAAASTSTGQEVLRLNYHTQQEADDAAV